MRARCLRLVLLAAVVALLVPGGAASAVDRPGPGEVVGVDRAGDQQATQPWFGVLELDERRAGTLAPAGLGVTVLPVAWDRWEPVRGRRDAAYAASVVQRYGDLRRAGVDVVLDLGVQYPPSWVWDLPAARMVDQHGREHHGGIGADVPDVVFNPEVRAAVGAYVADAGEALRGLDVGAVRIGGGPYNELRLPEPPGPARDSWWAFSASARAASPVPGWRPGDPGPERARAFLDWYTGSLTDYLSWQVGTYRRAFGPDVELHVLMPSWGVREGEAAQAAAGLLRGRSRGEARQTLQQGLDWSDEVRALDGVDHVVLWSTWLDARPQGADQGYEAPVENLARLSAGMCRPAEVGGENTGGGSRADMAFSVGQVRRLGLVGMLWMREPDLYDDVHASLADYRALVADARSS